MTRFASLVGAALACAASPALAQVQDGWDFEDGSLAGWTQTGDAFASQPTYGNNVEPRRPGESPGQIGRWWIGTYENRPNPAATAGAVQGDGAQGTLTSPPFRIETMRIDFLIGGGNDPEHEAVRLLIKQMPSDPPPRPGSLIVLGDGGYFVARTETGRNNEHMEIGGWNVSALLNREARIQIVDTSSAPWGHINADSFRGIYFTMPTEADLPPDPNGPPAGLGTATVVAEQSPPAPSRGLGTASVVVPQQSPTAPAYVPPVGTPGSTVNGGGTVVVVPQGTGTVARPAGGAAIMVNPPVGVQSGPARPLGGSLGDPPLPGGHYRLVATGFRVRHQTVDDMLERDGPGDEIFVRADILTYRNAGDFVGMRSVQTGVFGRDGDIRAGNGHQWNSADDQPGGLITGDIYPPRRPRFDTTASRVSRDFPFVVWEGDLQAGDAVLVIPSIWEWDSPEISPAQRAWEDQIRAQAGSLRVGASARTAQTIVRQVLGRFLSVTDEGTRPIGASLRGDHARSGPEFNPDGIVLTPVLNEQYLAQDHLTANDPSPASQQPGGPWQIADLRLSHGEIYLTFDDERELEGKYGLDLKLERVP